MSKLDPRLERRLDNYALLYCFNRPTEANRKVLEFVRRVYRINKKKKYASLKYYRQQRAACMSVRRSLEDYAKARVRMNQKEKELQDSNARHLILEVFPEDRENVFYLIDYYNQMKQQIK